MARRPADAEGSPLCAVPAWFAGLSYETADNRFLHTFYFLMSICFSNLLGRFIPLTSRLIR
jgi:hypothetical protein